MKKNKLLKTLLVLVMGIVMAFAAFGFTACKPDSEGDNNHTNEGDNNGNGDNEGDNEGDNNGNGDNNGDNEGDNENPPVVKQNVTINVSKDLTGNAADGAELKAGSGVYAVGALSRTTSVRTVIHPSLTDGKEDSTHRLQIGNNTAGLKVHLDTAATVLVYASGSSATSSGSLKLNEIVNTDGTDKEVAKGEPINIGYGGVKEDVGVATFAIEANKDYVIKRATSSTVNVVFIAIHYSAITENKGELVPADPASCGVAGMKAHYLSDYGNYYGEDGTTLKLRYELVEAALEHNYSLVPNSVTAATATATGTAQIKCANETEAINVELPVLTSPEYTTRPAAGESGTYTYVFKGVTITFTAQGVAQTELTYTTVYTNDFTSGNVGSDANVEAVGGAKIYAIDADTDATNTATAEIVDGALYVNGMKAYVTLENKIESGIVKITGELKCATANGSWTYFQILDSEGTEFVALRTTKSGSNLTQKCRVDGTETGEAVPVSISESFEFEIIIDLDTKVVTFKIGTTTLVDKVNYTKGLDLSSVMLNVNSGRKVYLNSLTVATQD